MAITYTEKIGEVRRYENKENYIRSLVFQVYATEGDKVGLYEERVILDDKPSSGFVTYSELEKEEGEATLIEWAKTKMGEVELAKFRRRAYRLIDPVKDVIVDDVPAAWTAKPVPTATNSKVI